jgi:hypothetical protein
MNGAVGLGDQTTQHTYGRGNAAGKLHGGKRKCGRDEPMKRTGGCGEGQKADI